MRISIGLTLFPLLLILIGFLVYVSTRSHHRLTPTSPTGGPSASPAARAASGSVSAPVRHRPEVHRPVVRRMDLADDLARWVDSGLLTDEQARAIAEHEQRRLVTAAVPMVAPAVPARKRRVPPVAEALGYIGGVLAVVGLGLLIGRSWNDMSVATRAAVTGGGAIALIAGGAFVHEQVDPALARLRAFLWLLGTAAATLSVGVLVRDGLDIETGRSVAILCAATAAVVSAGLWQWRQRPVQQVTCLAGTVVFVGTLVSQLISDGVAGLAIWLIGAAILVAGLRRFTPQPGVATFVGAAATAVGAAFSITDWSSMGLIFTLLTGFGLLAIAVVPGLAPTTTQQVIVACVGGITLLQGVPPALVHFADRGGLMTGLVVWLLGAALMAIGVRAWIRLPILAEIFGGLAVVGGAALTGVQYAGFAPLFGITTALVLIGLGTIPGRVLFSMVGSLGLLINVPWAIGHYFPGAGRAPLLIMVSGALIIAVAVLMTRMSGRMRTELRSGRQH